MTTYLLREGHAVRVDAVPIAIRVQSIGAPVRHRFEIIGLHGSVRTVHRPDQVIVPVIDQPVRVSLLPEDEVFGPQSLVTVSLAPDAPTGGGDADRAVLDSVDLSGLRRRDIVIMEPDAGRIKISTIGMVTDEALPPTAEMARDAARELLGVPRLPAERRVKLAVGLDSSASMRRLPPDRLVRPALEILAGLSVVIAAEHAVHGMVIGWESVPAPSAPAAEFADAMIKTLQDRGLDIGCRADVLASAAPRTVRYLITDAVPALRPGMDPPHVLMITEAQSAGEAGAGVTAVPIGRDDQLLDRGEVRKIVSSLLVGADEMIGES